MPSTRIILGDCIEGLRSLPDASVHCCVTSPPYWGLRDYGHDGQIGLESTPEAYVARMVEVFREVRRVLREDGTVWLNLGDSYAGGGKGGGGSFEGERPGWTAHGRMDGHGLKPKDLVGIPWRVAFAMQADGWWLRQDIIWAKPNPMPESVRDRCTKSHEYLFLLAKGQRYYYDAEAVKEAGATGPWDAMPPIGGVKHASNEFHGGRVHSGKRPASSGTRNRRSVWTITPKPYRGAHFSVMPPKLVEPCVRAGTSERGCCPQCGEPWERVVERDRQPTRPGVESKVYAVPPVAEGSPLRSHTGDICGNRDPMRHCTVTQTAGWRPTCTCPTHDPIPCTVLDPFVGSGTTLAVAIANGRSAIGIELNPAYVPLIEQRIAMVDAIERCDETSTLAHKCRHIEPTPSPGAGPDR
jgi:DNA modification methylase